MPHRFHDGSYLSKVYPSSQDRKRDRRGLVVRVIEFKLEGLAHPADGELYRLITTLVDPEEAPARELVALYHERWEIETAFDELKNLWGSALVGSSPTPGTLDRSRVPSVSRPLGFVLGGGGLVWTFSEAAGCFSPQSPSPARVSALALNGELAEMNPDGDTERVLRQLRALLPELRDRYEVDTLENELSERLGTRCTW